VNVFKINMLKVSITKKDIKKINELSKKKDVIEILKSKIAPEIVGDYIEPYKKALLPFLVGGSNNKKIHMIVFGPPSSGKSSVINSIKRLFDDFIVLEAPNVARSCNVDIKVDKRTKIGKILTVSEQIEKNEGNWIVFENSNLLDPEIIVRSCFKPLKEYSVGFLFLGTPSFNGINDFIFRCENGFSLIDASCINIKEVKDILFDLTRLKIALIPTKKEKKLKSKKPKISDDLFKKYIYYAKELNPELTYRAKKEIKKYIKGEVIKWGYKNIIIPFAPFRPLEQVCFLAEAYAKLRLKKKADVEDVKEAIKLVDECNNTLIKKIEK